MIGIYLNILSLLTFYGQGSKFSEPASGTIFEISCTRRVETNVNLVLLFLLCRWRVKERLDGLEIEEIRSCEELERAKTKGLTLVDFDAPWCVPCRLQKPILRQVAAQFQRRALIAVMNIDENRDLASTLGIQGIPTLILFRNGKEIQRFVGLQSESTLSEAVKKLLK
jgi:thioredoxin 1